jgi:hypothetical protein
MAIKPIFNTDLVLRGFGLQALKTKFYDFGEEQPDDKAPVSTSYLGTPVFMNIEFIPGTYKDKKGRSITYGNLLKNNDDATAFQINTVLVDVSQSKQIIKTNIQGVSGTVKEYISKGDYQVKIRGVLVDESSERYPQEQVVQLREYLDAETSIGVAGRFLNDLFDITDIVIEGYSFPQTEGAQNYQLFEITAVSDDPIELTVVGNG